MKSLYHIEKEYLDLMENVVNNEGEITPELEQQLTITQEALQEKAINYGFMIKSFEDDVELIDKEIARLTELKNKQKKNAELLKEKIENAMIHFGIEKIGTPTLQLSFRKSESVEVLNESQIPVQYINTKVTNSVDKVAIKKAIKEGLLVGGVQLVSKSKLQIK